MNDADIWKILEGIIDLKSRDVIAHDAMNEMPSDSVKSALKRFAQGDIEEDERAELCLQLKENPTWVTYLADCVREQRTA